ncbi:hypothetical protein CEXT_676831 [Caerostris extrusa]|uniref:Uncharacterized protein n=1 Tax=Caerostris extrusa TaxID=172846 RepID=A0AAV4UID1_CAEEX|nr:hypothetical protein CEXT_676831 [Caerostris extrusa]
MLTSLATLLFVSRGSKWLFETGRIPADGRLPLRRQHSGRRPQGPGAAGGGDERPQRTPGQDLPVGDERQGQPRTHPQRRRLAARAPTLHHPQHDKLLITPPSVLAVKDTPVVFRSSVKNENNY